jgi:protein-histidine pros-kinase
MRPDAGLWATTPARTAILVLHFVVIRPLRRIAAHANAVSTGNLAALEFELRGHGEIAALLQPFNRMRRSLANAMQMLESST